MSRGGPAPERAPDLQGLGGRAWRYDTSKHPTNLAQFLLECPGAHPGWTGWIVSVCHLRPVEGMPPAQLIYPQAEYEFMICSLDPRHPWPNPDRPMERPTRYLTPSDVVKQFHGVTDEQATAFAELAVKACVQGWLTPDQDFRREWERQVDLVVEHHKGQHFDA